jgi:hypothetical protein
LSELRPLRRGELRRERAVALDLGRHLRTGYHGPCWSKEQIVLLGTAPDEEIAARLGKSVEAVRVKRTRLEIPTFEDKRKK